MRLLAGLRGVPYACTHISRNLPAARQFSRGSFAAQLDVLLSPRIARCGEVFKSCGNKLMASIEIKNWTPALHHFTFGHGLAQTWWVQRE